MKISIITTTYNSENTIIKTLKSLQTQNYQNVEYIWIDNNSTDNTFEILKKNSTKNTMLLQVNNTRISEAWNIGIEKSTGEIIYFLNSDDVLNDDEVFSKVINVFNTYECNIIMGNILYVNNKNKIIRNWKININENKIISQNEICNFLKMGWMPPHPGFFIHRDIFYNKIFFNKSYNISFDYDFMIKSLISKNSKPVYLNYTISRMLIGGNSNKLTNIIQKMKEDLKIIYENDIGNFFTLIFKNLRKLPQFINFKNS